MSGSCIYTILRKLNSRNIPVLPGKVYSKSHKLSSISLPLPLPSITCCQFKKVGKPKKCSYKIQLNIINITCIHVSYWWVRTWKHQVEQTWQFDLALAFALCMYMYMYVGIICFAITAIPPEKYQTVHPKSSAVFSCMHNGIVAHLSHLVSSSLLIQSPATNGMQLVMAKFGSHRNKSFPLSNLFVILSSTGIFEGHLNISKSTCSTIPHSVISKELQCRFCIVILLLLYCHFKIMQILMDQLNCS